ncbi:MAG TPA: hypothetical protein PKD05_05535 [Candidatus Melainabacteria bacterium]|nr:hypothetical protein [Candidatus Melainabacteria bacterium]HMP50999.1 hypothetical protein [Candidatus Melainabacteria bacterium]
MFVIVSSIITSMRTCGHSKALSYALLAMAQLCLFSSGTMAADVVYPDSSSPSQRKADEPMGFTESQRYGLLLLWNGMRKKDSTLSRIADQYVDPSTGLHRERDRKIDEEAVLPQYDQYLMRLRLSPVENANQHNLRLDNIIKPFVKELTVAYRRYLDARQKAAGANDDDQAAVKKELADSEMKLVQLSGSEVVYNMKQVLSSSRPKQLFQIFIESREEFRI